MDTSTPLSDLFEYDRNVINSVPLLVIFKDTENNILNVNQTAASILDLPVEQLEGRPMGEVFPNEAETLHQGDMEVIETGIPKQNSVESITLPTGQKKWFRIDRNPWRNKDGQTVGIIVYASDITGQHEFEVRLRSSEALLKRAQQIAHLGSWNWDTETDQVRWSDEMYRVLGLEPGEVANPTYATFESRVHQDDRKTVNRFFRKALKRKKFTPFEFRTVPICGEIRTIEVHGEILLDSFGNVTNMAGIDQDITERKKVELKLKKTLSDLQRSNDELAEFAFIASHDLKAPLRAIDNITNWLEDDLGDNLPEESRGHLALMRQRVARMERLLTDLLAYSRFEGNWAGVEEVDVSELIDSIVSMGAFPETISFKCGDLPVFETVFVPIEHVFLNLIENATKHHDRETGTIRIECSDLGDTYEFTVEDDGPGIPPEHRDRVQKMFQTLKPRDQVEGSGMGLAFVKKIVEHLGCSITLESAEPRGCRARFSWPKQLELPTL